MRTFVLVENALRAATVWAWILAGSLLALVSGCAGPLNFYRDSVDKQIHAAARAGETAIVAKEIASGVSVEIRGEGGLTPLQIAAKNGKDEVVLLLLGNGASVDGDIDTPWKKWDYLQPLFNWSPLCLAAEGSHLSTAHLLLKKGADPDHWVWPPLFCAAAGGDVRIVELLLEKGAESDTLHQGAMHLAAAKGHEVMVDFLVEKGVSLTAEVEWSATPLHSAACEGQMRMVEKILRKGIDVDLATHVGSTPLYYAAMSDQTEMVRFLVKSGADANREISGGTPLFWSMASPDDNYSGVEALLESGADPNHFVRGRTPLYWAAYWDRPKLLEILLAHGADPHLTSDKGLTPLQEALAADDGKGHTECVRILEEAMAQPATPPTESPAK